VFDYPRDSKGGDGGMVGGGAPATLPPLLVLRPGAPSKHDFIGDP